MDRRHSPVPPAPHGLKQRSGRPEQPTNLLEVVRGYTAADWRDAMMFLVMAAIAITSAAALILLMEPPTP